MDAPIEGALLKFLSVPIDNATSSQAEGCDETSDVNSQDPARSSQSSSQFETDCAPLLLTTSTSTSTTPAEESSSTSPAKDTSTPPESEEAALTATLSVDPGLWPDQQKKLYTVQKRHLEGNSFSL
ncbi:unnamed protein product [Leuciscus chuanchicus]